MSIYSGFATRFQEEAYDNCIDSLLYILQKRIIKFYQGEPADEEKFISLVVKLHTQMRNMEKSKYLEPKSSLSVNQLIKFLNIHHSSNTPAPTSNIAPTSNARSKASEPAEVEDKPSLPDIPIQKKKSTFWVEKAEKKPIEIQSNKTQTEQEVQTMGTINKNTNDLSSKEEKFEFKRTAYQPRNIRALNVKNASKSKLSGQKGDERYLLTFDEKQPKKRAMSNHFHTKPVINHKQMNDEGENSHNHLHKRKSRSISRVNHHDQAIGYQGQVSDIIKDYILKAKKNYLRGYRTKEVKQSSVKVHDF